MLDKKSSKQIVRYTVESVFQAQERLRRFLDVLIAEDRPLRDAEERDLWFRLITYSLLGLGREQIVYFYVGSFEGLRCDLETLCRWVAYIDSSLVCIPMELRVFIKGGDTRVAEAPISVLWRLVRDNMFSVFPRAIDRSLSLSKEQEAGGKAQGYSIVDE